MKTFLYRSMIGIFFGAFLAVLFTYAAIYFGGKEMLDSTLFVKNSLGSIACGWFFTVSPLYFEIKTLRLIQQTILHFFTVTILYFTLAFGVGWISFNVKSIVLMVLLFLVTYSIIWTCFYLYFRKEVKKLNDELQRI